MTVPGHRHERIAEEIMKTGSSSVPVMGVSIDMQYSGEGARIASVRNGEGADKAGLKAGDVITCGIEGLGEQKSKVIAYRRAR